MPLHANSKLLIDTLVSLPLLDGRFANIQVINWDPARDEKRGCTSLVFRADDTVEGNRVALKFFDPDPALALDGYRREAFKRESEILQTLLNVDRCLQLVRSLNVFQLEVPGRHPPIVLPCQYFAVEWLDRDVDAYFLAGNANDPIDRLRLFNEIVLAVEALHRHEIFHRDLKPDNLRESLVALKRAIVAIDLGTAARFDSGWIQAAYGHSVGAPAYAAPEARCGLAGNRKVAPYTDTYALGCLLFELFNRDYFFRALRSLNLDFDTRIVAMAHLVTERQDQEKQVDQWLSAVSHFSHGVHPVPIASQGNDVPPGIAPILDNLLSSLTHVDFRRRPRNLARVRQSLWTAIRILEHDRTYKERLRLRRERRARRIQRAREVEARLEARRRAEARARLC